MKMNIKISIGNIAQKIILIKSSVSTRLHKRSWFNSHKKIFSHLFLNHMCLQLHRLFGFIYTENENLNNVIIF